MKSLELTSVVDVLGRAATASRPRVLVLAAQRPLRSIVATLLRAEGADAIEAVDEADALDQIAHALVDGDLHRPLSAVFCAELDSELRTTALLARLRAAAPAVPIVLLAKRSKLRLLSRAREVGAHVLPLPMPADALAVVLASEVKPAKIRRSRARSRQPKGKRGGRSPNRSRRRSTTR